MTSDPVVIIVTGWRDASTDRHGDIVEAGLASIHLVYGEVTLRHGKCKYGGVDLIADRIARGWGWEVDPMPAEELRGRILGDQRNRAMCAKEPRALEVVAFPGPGSTGTWSCLKWAAHYGIYARMIPLESR